MNLYSLVVCIQEALFRNRIDNAIIDFKKCAQSSKNLVDILFQEYNTQSYVKHVDIDELLKQINTLITYLNSRIYILQHKKYQNWIMPSPYVNKPKLLHDEIQKLCIRINTKLNTCDRMIQEYKETPYVKSRARSI